MQKVFSNPTISVVIPIHNEEDNLLPVYQGVKKACEQSGDTWELIFVDDGSVDKSYAAMQSINRGDSRVKVIQLRRNFGQTSALAAGFDHARGDVIVTMDGDQQNDAADIPRLLAKLDEGYDVVSGWRKERKDPLFSKRIPSMLANKLAARLTGVHLHDFGCTLKAYRRDVIDEINLYSDFHRFIPALAASIGASVAEIQVAHHPRINGTSKYGAARIILGFLDLISLTLLLNFMSRPMRVLGGFGLLLMAATGLSGLATLLMKFILGADVTGNPLLYLTILLSILGIQFIGLGFLGEMTMRTYFETQRKPTYVVRDILGGDSTEIRVS